MTSALDFGFRGSEHAVDHQMLADLITAEVGTALRFKAFLGRRGVNSADRNAKGEEPRVQSLMRLTAM